MRSGPYVRFSGLLLVLRESLPTWLVGLGVYGGYVLLTLAHRSLPLPLLMVGGGLVLAWHGSLQHETIHGHPGPRWAQRLLGGPPLSLWLPYSSYRDTHRRHHATRALTDPEADPESALVSRAEWERFGPVRRALVTAERTLVGRLVLGPFTTVASFLRRELRPTRTWAAHAVAVSVVLAWVVLVAEMPVWKYLVAFVYPGTSLALLRAFVEHRADAAPERRTVVVETSWFFRLLFLNNNDHAVHHRNPHLPWFRLPEARRREALVAADPVVPGYLSVARRYAFAPASSPVFRP